MNHALNSIYTADIMNADGDATEATDLRELSAERLQALSTEAAEGGDLQLAAICDMILVGAEPIRMGSVETIRVMMGDEATEADAWIMHDLLAERGHIAAGYLCITDSAWDDLDREAADLAEAAR